MSLAEARPWASKSLTSPAIETGYSLASKARISSTPLRPARAASHVALASLPMGVTAPIPVMTTLRIPLLLRRGEAELGYAGNLRPRAASRAPLPAHGGGARRTSFPEGDGWQYEPKWDGFRGVLENVGRELHLWSRNARPLLRYFPELAELGERLPPRSALDGEIVIVRDGALDFDALQMRLHPAESRVQKLSAEIPADFVCFDVLLWDGEAIHKLPLEERRARVEGLPFSISPATRDVEGGGASGSTGSRWPASTA